MILPVKNQVMTSDFGPRVLFGEECFHNGIDLISRESNSVYAMADGEAIYDMDNYDNNKRWTHLEHSAGNYLIVKHILSVGVVFVRYLHLGINMFSKGDLIHEGDIIGKYGDYGISFGPHLHFDIYDANWSQLNPHDIPELEELLKGAKQ